MDANPVSRERGTALHRDGNPEHMVRYRVGQDIIVLRAEFQLGLPF